MTSELLQTTPDSEIVNSRTFKVSREHMYRAWTDPNHLKNWWGPQGFTNTFHEFDLRIGGKWSFIMHGPDKGNYANECEFILIEAPSRIAWKRHSKPLFQVLATFEELTGDETKVVFKMLFETEEECQKLKKYVVDKNEENFDRLEVELTKMTVQKRA
ncbi:MAG: ATPase [Bacteroidetes bacterium RIFCSPHIGHO2_02_FULL_44_7]|nr:MAG: ATPase [Bacteroidetes bacterium RIFCSPHIGHO2_02_FULL_44_7]